MQLALSPSGVCLRLGPKRRAKYTELIEWYLNVRGMTKSQASELAGRLNWACNALLGRCGRAFLAPILRRAANADPRWELNARLGRSLGRWAKWRWSPEEYLVRSIHPLRPPLPKSPCRLLL